MGTNGPAMVPLQYGGVNMSSLDSVGAWLATAADLVRFSSSFAQTNSPLLPADLIATMWSQPQELPGSPAIYYGAGWWVRPLGGGVYNAWHNGSNDGTFAYTVRRADGYCWAVIFNRRDVVGDVPDYNNIDSEMNAAINSIATWPHYDLFDANGDGLLDAWQVHYFGSIGSSAAAPSADPDGDGANNWQEWRCGTVPTNSLSVLRLLAPVTASTNVRLSWQSVAGVSYFLERATSLSASPAFTPLATNVSGQPGTTTYTDTNAIGAGRWFYRVGVSTP